MADKTIYGQLRRKFAVIIAVVVTSALPVTLAQEYSFSNGKISFKSYRAISYPYKGRRAGVETEIKMRFYLDVSGNVYKVDFENKSANLNDIKSVFEEEIRNRVRDWQFINEEAKPMELKVDVKFLLSGTIANDDAKSRNLIVFSADSLTIIVKSTKIIPVIP